MNETQRRLLDAAKRNSALSIFADPTRRLLLIEPYTYTVDFMVPLAGATRIRPGVPFATDVIMDSDSDFVMTDISAGSLMNFAVAQTKLQWNPALLLQITDKSAGRTYFNTPTLLPLVAGFNGFPFILASPRVLKPRTTLHLDVMTATTDNNAQYFGFFLCFHGAKIYYGGSQ